MVTTASQYASEGMSLAVFGGSVGGAGPESIVLWQLIGIGLSTIVAPACLSLKVCSSL
jgi:hypothetical protein